MCLSSIDKKGSWWERVGIIGILVVVSLYLILNFIGIPGGGSRFTTQCSPYFNYQCTNVTYLHETGNATLNIGQKTGMNWTYAIIFFVPQGTNIVNGTPIMAINGYVLKNGIENNKSITVTLDISSPVSTQYGQLAAGDIFAQYWTSTKGPYYVRIASITMKAK